MKKIITVFICVIFCISLFGCSSNANGDFSNQKNEVRREDIHNIKTLRKALQNWCSKNYVYDEDKIKNLSSKGADDKMLKESYKNKQYFFNFPDYYSFYIDTSRVVYENGKYLGLEKEMMVDSTSVSCFNYKNDGNPNIIYFEDVFILKVDDEKMKKIMKEKNVPKNTLLHDGYFYSLGQENTNRDLKYFLEEYVKGNY